MHIESLKTVLLRDIADLQEITSNVEQGYALSRIEVQILQSRVKNLAAEISELIERISAGDIAVNGLVIKESPVSKHQFDEKQVVIPVEPVSQTKQSTKVEPIEKEVSAPKQTTQKQEPARAVSVERIVEEVPQKVGNLAKEKATEAAEKTEAENVKIVEKPSVQPIQQEQRAETNVETPKTEIPKQSPLKPESLAIAKPEKETPAGKKTLADQFTDSMVSVNERVGLSGQAVDRASMLSRKPIADIHKAIKLNDRIGFMLELFGGDAQKYTQTIDALNNFSDFDQALDFINQNFSWDQNSENFKTLIEIVYRRYMQ